MPALEVTTALVGTAAGLFRLDVGDASRTGRAQPQAVPELAGRSVTAVSPAGDDRWLALVEGRHLWRGGPGRSWAEVAALDGDVGTCVSAAPGGALVGTREAHLLFLDGGTVTRLSGFDQAEGRDRWYTPWGGPPDTRSVAVADDGVLYVNVHVGGIVRSDDGGATWHPTIDVDTDVHQVVARQGSVLAAAAYGLGVSDDGGDSWAMLTDGLHATYLRAVGASGGTVMVSASTGPDGRRSAVYRMPAGGGRFERCRQGLPEWFPGNVDTGWLAVGAAAALVGTAEGTVYGSTDGGDTWAVVADELPPVTAVVVAR